MYKTPKFYGPQLLYQMVKVHFYFFIGKVLLLESYHKIMKAFPWIFRIYRSIFKTGRRQSQATSHITIR